MAGPAQLLIEAFEDRYRRSPDLFQAPGRVNLIGEFTDFNLGLVLPIAIDLACYAAAAPNRDGQLRFESLNLRERRQWPIEHVRSLRPAGDWSDYIIGVARQLSFQRGCDLMIHSAVPPGSGLSSSAALEVSTALALGWSGDLPSLDLARLCRRAENDFVGLPSGIMDQYVSIFGRPNAALLIDCRSLENEAVPLPEGISIIAVNSMVKHELAKSAYAERVAECARAAAEVGVESLRDVRADQLALIRDPVAIRRARHVVSENQRVRDFADASLRGDIETLGRLLVASHRSLRDDFEVSCAELDFLVDTALAIPGVIGARLTGGGFGGCTVNLLRPGSEDRFEEIVAPAYKARFGVDPAFYRVRPSGGATRL